MRLTCALHAIEPPSIQLLENIRNVFNRTDRKRRHILEPSLCTSVLDVLKPTLPPPSSCDIIDVNPGSCIWSKALHDAIKPRRHVLVEDNRDLYKTALDPLLEENGSYRYAPDLQTALDPKASLLTASWGHSGEASKEQKDVYGKVTVNKNLIITANLAGRVIEQDGYKGHISKRFLDQYYRSLASRSKGADIHQNGLVRLLVWVPEDEKYSIMPRTVVGRTNQSIRLEASCHIREIVSYRPYSHINSLFRRWYHADIETMKLVAEKQALLGLNIPPDRLPMPPQPPSTSIWPDRAHFHELMSLEMRPPLIDELVRMSEHIKEDDPEWHARYFNWKPTKGRPPKNSMRPGAPKGSDKDTLSILMNRLRTTHFGYKRIEDMVNKRRGLEDIILASAKRDGAHSEAFRSTVHEIEPQLASLRDKSSKFFKDSRLAVEKALDDYRAIRTHPPALAWNEREFEPILSKTTDFYPQTPMTLLEFSPRVEFVEMINTANKQICFDYVVFCFEWERASSVAAAIRRITSTGYEEFVNAIPNLFDPVKGGWYNLEHIRPRSLPTTLLIEIGLAYEQWPFRPSLEQMMEVTSSLKLVRKMRFD